MMRLIDPWVRVQTGIDHNPVDKVIHHSGDAVDTAKALVKARGSHCVILLSERE
jgi:hypothetical protein